MITPFVSLIRGLWWNLVRRDRVEAALDEELRAYVDLLAAEYERAGMTPAAARRAALVDTGGMEQVKEATRHVWVGDTLATTGRELRYAVRVLRRSPAFLVIAIVTLALGIGGATSVFTVINASLLRPLPGVGDPDRLVTVERVQLRPTPRQIAEFSYPDYRDLRDHARTLAGLAAYNGTSMALNDPAGSARAWVSFVSRDFFTVLGVRPAVGRLFEAEDTSSPDIASEQVVVLGHELWQTRFGGSADAIGSTLKLDDHAFTIIGVAPPGFIGAMSIYRMELWIPVGVGGRASPVLGGLDLTSRRDATFRLVGRLAPGSSIDDARTELASIAERLEAVHATNRGRTVRVFVGTGMTAEERAQISRVPRLLAMAVVVLLLIACANVANLSLVRAAARRRELATRLALGASRGLLLRQVALEGALIALGAGMLGIFLAHVLVRSATLVQTVVPISGLAVEMDRRVLVVAIGASAVTAVLVSLLPAIQLFRVTPGAVLRDGKGTIRRGAGQPMLVALQVGASIVLLSSAAIVYSTFQRVLTVHDGLEPETLTDVIPDLRTAFPDRAAVTAFHRELLARASADPEITSVALTSTIPPFQWSATASVFRPGEEPPRETLIGREAELGLRVEVVRISEGFFDVMRIPLVRGRSFTASDDERAAPVVIVGRRVAAELWPDRDPIGQFLSWPTVEGPPRSLLRVVGVAADIRGLSPSAPPPFTMYLPYAQHPLGAHILIARGPGNAPVAPSTLRRLIADVNADVAVRGGRTLLDRLQDEVRPQRTASAWIGVFGAIALLLATIGLYGVVTQGVLQRTRELAVRSALGATPAGILGRVLADGMRLAALGGVVGMLGTLASFRVLQSLFAGVEAVNARPAAITAMVLAVAILVAILLPARRAARLDPVEALRCD